MHRLPDNVMRAMFAQAKAIAAACRQHAGGVLDAQDGKGNLDMGDADTAPAVTKGRAHHQRGIADEDEGTRPDPSLGTMG